MDEYLGTISAFAFNFAPAQGWMACNGQALPISQYDALYTLIGTTYGGDGINTFCLPDLRGRTIINQGQGRGLSNIVIGQRSGTTAVTMNTLNLPQHAHVLDPKSVSATTTIFTTSAGGGTNEPGAGEFSLGSGGSFPAIYSDAGGKITTEFVAGLKDTVVNTTIAGGSQPLDVTNPYVGVNICICVSGIFPSQQ